MSVVEISQKRAQTAKRGEMRKGGGVEAVGFLFDYLYICCELSINQIVEYMIKKRAAINFLILSIAQEKEKEENMSSVL